MDGPVIAEILKTAGIGGLMIAWFMLRTDKRLEKSTDSNVQVSTAMQQQTKSIDTLTVAVTGLTTKLDVVSQRIDMRLDAFERRLADMERRQQP